MDPGCTRVLKRTKPLFLRAFWIFTTLALVAWSYQVVTGRPSARLQPVQGFPGGDVLRFTTLALVALPYQVIHGVPSPRLKPFQGFSMVLSAMSPCWRFLRLRINFCSVVCLPFYSLSRLFRRFFCRFTTLFLFKFCQAYQSSLRPYLPCLEVLQSCLCRRTCRYQLSLKGSLTFYVFWRTQLSIS